MHTTVFLIRHGEIDNPKNILYGRSVDLILNKTGEEQIKALGLELKKRGIKPVVIYTSPLSRAIQSAKILEEVFRSTLIVKDDRFLEVNHPGLENYTLGWYSSIGEDIYTYTGKEVEGLIIEMPEMQAMRMMDGIKSIQKKYRGKTVFIVSHGDPIVFTYYKLLNPTEVLKGRRDFLTLKSNIYPEKGTAIRLVLDEEIRVVEHERIIP